MDALATTEELEARLGRPLTTQESARATAILQDASAKIRAYTRQTFDSVDDDTVVMRVSGGEIRLPQRPVRSVSAVVVIGAFGSPDFPMIDWAFDGTDIIRLGSGSCIVNLPEAWYEQDYYLGTYRVTYSHGYGEVPDDIVAKCCEMVLRTLTNPSMAGGISQETVGPYMYKLEDDSVGGGLAVRLTADDKVDLEPYRRKASTIQMSR